MKIPGHEVPSYIKTYEENFDHYERLKGQIPTGGSFETKGAQGMTISIGGYFPGVRLPFSIDGVTTRDELQRVTDAYRYALKRAPQVQAFLSSL